jgi:hypothetical protein
MLQCKCGYVGFQLVPNYIDNTARCPKCNTIFVGIPAKDAIYCEHKASPGPVCSVCGRPAWDGIHGPIGPKAHPYKSAEPKGGDA